MEKISSRYLRIIFLNYNKITKTVNSSYYHNVNFKERVVRLIKSVDVDLHKA